MNIYGYAPAGHQAEIEEYLKYDCLSLVEIMTSFRKELLNNELIQIDICDCFTSATLSKKLYFEKYYGKICTKTIWKDGVPTKTKNYIYQVGKVEDKYIRESYQGGRCDIYKYGHF